MFGLAKAATTLLLVLPALGAAALGNAHVNEPRSRDSALVTLRVPLGEEDAIGVVSLKLEVEAAEQDCGPANIKINGQRLSQDLAGVGHGVLTADDGATITASWSVTCIELANGPNEQLLRFTLRSFNGEPVPDVPDATFSSSFRQTNPPAVLQMGWNLPEGEEDSADEKSGHTAVVNKGPYMVEAVISEVEKDVEDAALVASGEEEGRVLAGRLRQLRMLRQELELLEKLVAAKEAFIRENYNLHPEALLEHGIQPTAPAPAPSPTSSAAPASQTGSPHLMFSGKHDQLHLDSFDAAPGNAAPSPTYSSLSSKHVVTSDDYFGLVAALGIAAIIFGLITLCGIAFVHRRLTVYVSEQRRRRLDIRGGGRRHETWEEREARRANRREASQEAILSWLKKYLPWSLETEKTNAAEVEAPAPAPRDEETTMEQELAQFREAAAMVGNLVAAEEGRTQRREPAFRPVAMAPRPEPRFVRATYVEVSTDDEDVDSLPPYESEPEDTFVVADGFRYMRPSSESARPMAPPEEIVRQQEAGDRLGYGK
ncbi:hypothetical protein B0I35DRAFT_472719 [Stachybotrys elegans]|uniref:Uncharacterized protein n=1 Tax=Stachybotrys elegans TaxID=80388 RepID=A0A8K0T338_9HYPO|nr:hypothetical protein B0I35DRAFT_472719 [Stachybotrys elegans]